MTIEQNRYRYGRLALIISGRNAQRAISGDLTPGRISGERWAMDRLLDSELTKFNQMRLTNQGIGPINVNPQLTTFLDGSDGLGGYADSYAYREYMEPGTKLEMSLESNIIKRHLSSLLTPDYLQCLKKNGKPLVIVEGGAGPDLRTFQAVCDVLRTKKELVNNTPVKVVITDISKRMAAITASKIHMSQGLIDPDIDVQTAVLAADVFEFLEILPKDSLTYALLPFGVLSFGLDGKDLEQTLEGVSGKLINGGGMLTTVYHSGWVDHSNNLREMVEQLIDSGGRIDIKELSPFIIDIRNGAMQVGGGLAFNCRTFLPQELADIIGRAGLKADEPACMPAGWSHWSKGSLVKVVEGRMYPEGCPTIPSPNLMNLAKREVLDLVSNSGGNNSLVNKLATLIPSGDQINNYPAPYVTITAQKPTIS